jgi:hypothetical protein
MTTVQPQSIWGASEGIRFKPPALTVDTENWAMEREADGVSGSMPAIDGAGGAYELRDLTLDGKQ